MTRHLRGLHCQIAVTLALGAVAAACAPSQDARAAARARRVAETAQTDEQRRLWREAADRGWAPGLERLSPGPALEARVPPPLPPQTSQSPPPEIPGDVQNAIRLVSAARVKDLVFNGAADVVTVNGDRIELEVGAPQPLTVLARVGGMPLAVAANKTMNINYHVRSDPRQPHDLLALRIGDGRGILSLVEGGSERITRVSVPLFNMIAAQNASDPAGRVDVTVGSARRTLAVGETAEVGGLTVQILGSRAATAAQAEFLEGSRYVLDLMAWRVR